MDRTEDTSLLEPSPLHLSIPRNPATASPYGKRRDLSGEFHLAIFASIHGFQKAFFELR
jgi:hypothetical protein